MPKVMPKIVKEVIAIRLKDDLIIELGNWLIVHSDDRVESMTDAQIAEVYDVSIDMNVPQEAQNPKNIIHPRTTHVTRKRLLYQTVDGKLGVIGAQTVRILSGVSLANKQKSQVTTRDINLYLHSNDIVSVSSRLKTASRMGLVNVTEHSNRVFYTITPEGQYVVNILGTEAKKYVEKLPTKTTNQPTN
jgi:hypothetical protein